VTAFASVRSNGLIAMALDEDDYLGWVKHTSGNRDLILVTRQGQSNPLQRTRRARHGPPGGRRQRDPLPGAGRNHRDGRIIDPGDTLLGRDRIPATASVPTWTSTSASAATGAVSAHVEGNAQNGRIISAAVVSPTTI